MLLGYLRLHSISSDLRLENCPVRPVAAKAVKKFAPQFIYKKLQADLEDFDDKVITDEKWLLFVLEQLISNAVKYTVSGGITISMGPGHVLSVCDIACAPSPRCRPVAWAHCGRQSGGVPLRCFRPARKRLPRCRPVLLRALYFSVSCT